MRLRHKSQRIGMHVFLAPVGADVHAVRGKRLYPAHIRGKPEIGTVGARIAGVFHFQEVRKYQVVIAPQNVPGPTVRQTVQNVGDHPCGIGAAVAKISQMHQWRIRVAAPLPIRRDARMGLAQHVALSMHIPYCV